MTTFTDLLDEYLEAKAAHAEARNNFSGYDFEYFHYKDCRRLSEARKALNAAYDKVNRAARSKSDHI